MSLIILIKAVGHNIFVLVVCFILAFIASRVDLIFGFELLSSVLVFALGCLLFAIGFLIRVWAAYHFYKNQINVIVLHAQQTLVTGGPFKYTRNPLYLGGNIFMFLGASLIFGTIVGVILTVLHLPLLNLMVQKEEKDLEKKFGKQFISYKQKVPRWIPRIRG